MTDIFTEEIKDLLKLATTDFNKFYKETEKQNKSTGNSSTAASSGNGSKAASSGYDSTAASSGNYSKAASSGVNSACSALGYMSCVKGDIGNLLMCSEFDESGKPLGGKADVVDGVKIKPDTWYSVLDGKWTEVDLTDGIFSYVVSVKGNVKKLKNSNGNFSYLVSDDQGNSAHGKTIKEARDDLSFKLMSKDVEQFKNMPLKTTKTPQEWAMVYRAITGACQYGTKQFMEQKGKLKEKYTLKEILEQTDGAYGSERFKEVVRGTK